MAAATWNTGSGNWFTATNWNEANPSPPPPQLHAVPGAGDDASIPDNSAAGTPFTIAYNGTSTINTLSGAANGTLDISGGSLTLANGAAANGMRIDVDAGATINVAAGTAIATAGTIAGTVGGGGTYMFLLGPFNIDAGASFTVANWVLGVTLNGTVSSTELNTNLAYGGNFTIGDFSGNHAFLDTNGNTLTLSGNANIDGTIQGAGTVRVTGTAVLGSTGNGQPVIDHGATLRFGGGANAVQHLAMTLGDAATTGTLQIDAGAVYSIDKSISIGSPVTANAAVTNAGQLRIIGASTSATIDAAFSSTGTVSIGNGNSLLLTGGETSTLAGTVNGAGTLIAGNGTTVLNGPSLAVSHFHLDGGNGGGTVRLDANLSYGGELAFAGQFDTLDLNAKTLTLAGTGSTLFGNTLQGAGTLRVTGAATIGNNLGATLATPLTIQNSGTLNQTGAISLNGTLLNDSGRTYTLTGISQVNDFGAIVQNNGTLLDSAAGTSTISADFTNAATGTVSVAAGAQLVLNSGTQTLGGTLSGAGTLTFGFGANATIAAANVGVAAITLAGGNGGATVALGTNLAYAGALSFAGQFDTIALAGRVLTLTGANNSLLGNVIDGGGASRLKISGAATLGGNLQIGQSASVAVENAGTVNQNGGLFLFGSVVNNAGRTWSFAAAGALNSAGGGASFTNNGTLRDDAAGDSAILASFTNTGTVTIGAGATLRFGGTTTALNGTVNGAGTLFLGGGTASVDSAIATAFWHVGGNGAVTLARDIAYGGGFTLDGPFTTLALAGHSLGLTGPTDFGGGTIVGDAGLADTLSVTGTSVDLSALGFTSWTDGQDVIAIAGTAGADSLTGSIRQDAIAGGGGNDTLDGRAGADTLTGGAGDDTYVNPAGDTIVEAAGSAGGVHDLVLSAASFNLAAAANVEDITLTGTANVNAIGNNATNRLTGNEGNNTLNGGGGNDFLAGLGGADTLNGGPGNDIYLNPESLDIITEAAGTAGGDHDRVQTLFSFNLSSVANVEDITLVGAASVNAIGNNLANILIGNAGNNTINGGGGADTITGGADNDTMNGGAAADLFKFATTNTGADTIAGFETALDRFDLAGGTFSGRVEAGGSTTLTHAGGTILVTGVTGLSLAQWRDLIDNGAREAAARPDEHDPVMGRHAAGFAAWHETDGTLLAGFHADYAFF